MTQSQDAKRFLAEILATLDDDVTAINVVIHTSSSGQAFQFGCADDHMLFAVKLMVDSMFEDPESSETP